MSDEVLRVKKDTDIKKLSGSIVRSFEESANKGTKNILLKTIGAGALNQAIKGVIESSSYFSKKGISVRISPSFAEVREVPDRPVTSIELLLIFDRV